MELFLLIPILPLVGFAIQVFFGRKLPRGGDWVPLTCIGVAFLLSLRIFVQALSAYDPDFKIAFGPFVWLDLTTYKISVGILVDNITAIMLMVVTTVSLLVHLYSTE